MPNPPDPDAVSAAFRLGSPTDAPAFVVRTLSSNVWRLNTTEGSWALKEPLGRPDAARFDEVFALETAAAAAAIRLPRPVAADDGHALVELPGGSGSSVGVRAWEWVELSPIATPAPAHEVAQLGAALARLHMLPSPPDARPFHPWYCETPSDTAWDDLARAALALAADAPWASTFLGALDDVRGLSALARQHPPTSRSTWCHFDLLPQNCGTDEHGDVVILDWDDAAPGDPSRELGTVVVAWTEPGASAGALLDAYEHNGGPGRLDSLASLSIAAAFRCNYLSVVVRAALDVAADEASRQSSGREVENVLAKPMSVDRLRAYLDGAA